MAPKNGSNLHDFTVSEISQALKRTVEEAFGYVRVRGELSQLVRHGSGHIYFRLKDEAAVLDGVCWRGTAQKLKLRPEDGMEVICTGRLSTYANQSRYQLIVDRIELSGEGALLKLLEERKRKLTAEGLFEAERKRPLPYLPEVIGVVTSPTGAVIRDILHRLADRFPRHVLVWPVAVQGEQAAAQVAAAIAGFNALPPHGSVPTPDVLIIARGGGSLEDLMAFNEEIVVRAAAASRIPLISAVGHETDTTLIDLAADLRAPTPTAAAEVAVPVRADLTAQLLDIERRLYGAGVRLLSERRTQVQSLARGLGDPRSLLDTAEQRLDDRAERLHLAAKALLIHWQTRTTEAAMRLRHPREQLADARSRITSEARALAAALRQVVVRGEASLGRISGRLTPTPLRARLTEGLDRLNDRAGRLTWIANRACDDAQTRLETQAQLLESVSYKRSLARGYVVVRDAQSAQTLTHAAATTAGQNVTLVFQDGETPAVIADPDGSAQPPDQGAADSKVKTRMTRKKGKTPADTPEQAPEPKQGSLF